MMCSADFLRGLVTEGALIGGKLLFAAAPWKNIFLFSSNYLLPTRGSKQPALSSVLDNELPAELNSAVERLE